MVINRIKQVQEKNNIFTKTYGEKTKDQQSQSGMQASNFEIKIDDIENYICEVQEFMKKGNIQRETIKIDLGDISSGDGNDDSDESSSSSDKEPFSPGKKDSGMQSPRLSGIVSTRSLYNCAPGNVS